MRTRQTHAPQPLDGELSIFQSITGRMQGFLYRQLNDADFTVIYATPSIRNVTGYPLEDFLGNAIRTLPSLTEPEDEAYVLDIVQDALRKHERWTVDYRIRTASRGALWVREMGGGVFGDDGELLFLEGLVIEVQGERAARLASEKRLRAMTAATGTILEDVDDILKAIRALSILSFNARVEAARAGNTGLGFAVVAAEMKRLADDTDKLAKQISTHVKTVRQTMADE
ncbi:PAS domain-containing protein [Trinickia terrae]|uniref:PAS domain-containing protein n=1 Tax=Trinickia terrae TaxID=2571161 RepID=A0A4V5PJJ1_9BURK|nr:PAS domain-containing protein [Trinickia terrae]TKC88680.1 PAS domain-containing protein [Trinickia terrae]